MLHSQSRKIPKQAIFGLIAIVVLVIGVAIAAVVSNKQQDNRQQATGSIDCAQFNGNFDECAIKHVTDCVWEGIRSTCDSKTPRAANCDLILKYEDCINPDYHCAWDGIKCVPGSTTCDQIHDEPNCISFGAGCSWDRALSKCSTGSGSGGTIAGSCAGLSRNKCKSNSDCTWTGASDAGFCSEIALCSQGQTQCINDNIWRCNSGQYTVTTESCVISSTVDCTKFPSLTSCNANTKYGCGWSNSKSLCLKSSSVSGGSSGSGGSGGVPTSECSDYCAGPGPNGQCAQQGGRTVDRPCSFAACAPNTAPCKIDKGGTGGGSSSGGGSSGGGTTSTSKVIGEAQFLDCSMVYGYACDSLDWSRKLRVAIYVDSFVQDKIIDDTAPLANLFRDSYVGSKCGNDIAHGFKLDLTTHRAKTLLEDGKPHTLLVRAIGLTKNDSNGSLESNPSKGPFQPIAAAAGVNLTITCNAAGVTTDPTANPTGTPVATPTTSPTTTPLASAIPTATPIAAATPTPAVTPTPAATPISSPNPQCGATCATNNDCPLNHTCSNEKKCILNECQTKSCDNNKCYRIEYVTNTITNTLTSTVISTIYVSPTPATITTDSRKSTKGETIPVSGTIETTIGLFIAGLLFLIGGKILLTQLRE